MKDELLSPRQVADLVKKEYGLCVSVSTFRRWMREGTLASTSDDRGHRWALRSDVFSFFDRVEGKA